MSGALQRLRSMRQLGAKEIEMSNHDDDLPDEYFEPRIAKTPIPKDAAAERKRLMEKLRQVHSDEAEIERLRTLLERAALWLRPTEHSPPECDALHAEIVAALSPNAIGQGSAACGASPAPQSSASAGQDKG